MADSGQKRLITAADKEFAAPIADIFRRVERDLTRHDVALALFRRLQEQWYKPQPLRSRDRWAGELTGSQYDPARSISKAANRIRAALEQACPYRGIVVKVSRGTYALIAEFTYSETRTTFQRAEHVIGMLISSTSDWVVSPVLAGAERILREKRYQLLIRGANDEALTEANCLEEMRPLVEGIIALPVSDGDIHRAYARLLDTAFPLVFVDRAIPQFEGRLPAVMSDNEEGGYQATVHLIEHHRCKRVHVIADYPVASSIQREQGSLRACEEKKVEQYVHKAENRRTRVASIKWAFRKVSQLITDAIIEEGDGIFGLNDNLAAGCRCALEAKQLTAPVIGFDGQHWGAFLSPPLETIAQDFDAMAAEAASVLLRWIAGDPQSNTLHIPIELRTAEDRLLER